MSIKSLSQERIDELTAETEKFAKEWNAKGCPELSEEDLEPYYLNVSKVFPELSQKVPYNGVPTEIDIIYNTKWLSVKDILDEGNLETKRLLISKFGTHRFLKEGGAESVTEEDARGYQIVRFPVEDTSWYFLRMVNSTLEPQATGQTRVGMVDGGLTDEGYKIYFLRLPASLVKKEKGCTNEEAVAWSFRSKVKKGHIYSNTVNTNFKKSRDKDYIFKNDKREFTYQARQGDVHIRLVAKSMEDLLAGNLYRDNGYDPDEYRPDVES